MHAPNDQITSTKSQTSTNDQAPMTNARWWRFGHLIAFGLRICLRFGA
jgi:hypothetical protein